jgi:hypothetical protein
MITTTTAPTINGSNITGKYVMAQTFNSFVNEDIAIFQLIVMILMPDSL